jgi:hypothetical protein
MKTGMDIKEKFTVNMDTVTVIITIITLTPIPAATACTADFVVTIEMIERTTIRIT